MREAELVGLLRLGLNLGVSEEWIEMSGRLVCHARSKLDEVVSAEHRRKLKNARRNVDLRRELMQRESILCGWFRCNG